MNARLCLFFALVLLGPALAAGAEEDDIRREQDEESNETIVDYAELCPEGGSDSFCMPVDLIERLLAQPLDIVEAEKTAVGLAKTFKMTLRATDPETGRTWVFPAKWRSFPKRGKKLNNQPARELAAYELQTRLWPEDRYLVPPSAIHCMDIETMREELGGGVLRPRGMECVPGLVTWWVENVTQGEYWQPERWETDRAYRRAFADFNLFAYIIDHRDSRDANFVRAEDPEDPRILSIDHGLSFAGMRHTRFLIHLGRFEAQMNFARLVAPAIVGDVVHRLRGWTDEDIESFRTLTELRIQPDGTVIEVEPGPLIEGRSGVRRDGDRIQLGLGKRERHLLTERIEELLEDVDEEGLATFMPAPE